MESNGTNKPLLTEYGHPMDSKNAKGCVVITKEDQICLALTKELKSEHNAFTERYIF